MRRDRLERNKENREKRGTEKREIEREKGGTVKRDREERRGRVRGERE